MSYLKDKVCVVTGASSGIGKAIAAALASRDTKVVGLARRFESESVSLKSGLVSEVCLDITDEERVSAIFKSIGDIDILINNAGPGFFAPLWEMRTADLRAMLDVHVIGTFLCTRGALHSMRARDAGHIVNIGSIATFQPFHNCSGYTAAKAAQLGMTRILREEVREANIRVTSLSPGAVNTPIWDDRPQFDRTKMIDAGELAEFVLDIVSRPSMSVDEVTVVPLGGSL